jgi:hypothetical protein
MMPLSRANPVITNIFDSYLLHLRSPFRAESLCGIVIVGDQWHAPSCS